MMISICGKCQCCLNIFFNQIREIRQDFLVTHARSQPTKNIINRYTHVPNTWLTSSFPCFNGNSVTVWIHRNKLVNLIAFASRNILWEILERSVVGGR